MTDADDTIHAPQRLRVRQLAATGLPAETIRLLAAPQVPGDQFRQLFGGELMFGAAEADLAVATALFELATSGKSIQATLAWARQRLGWAGENEASLHDNNPDTAAAANGWLGLQTLMDELAARKAALSQPEGELDQGGAAQPVAAAS